jgi:hypothetical protein
MYPGVDAPHAAVDRDLAPEAGPERALGAALLVDRQRLGEQRQQVRARVVPAASGTAITARAGITVPAGSGDQRDDTTFKATRNTITAASALPVFSIV